MKIYSSPYTEHVFNILVNPKQILPADKEGINGARERCRKEMFFEGGAEQSF
ncbi:MAG: hypothetical protein LBH90_06035 [Tannerella sp.]|jgi:hypothetical protein|nr:hypothetical protein [Tannerella sp.]